MRRLKRRTALLVCAATLAGFAGSAAAKPAHKPDGTRHHQAAASPRGLRAADRQPYPFASVRAAGKAAKAHSKVRQARNQARTHNVFGGFTTNSLVADARKYLGTNPTNRRTLWCGAFMDKVLRDTGHKGGGNLALGYVRYGRRVPGPQVGAIAVMARRGGGHVGVVSGIDPNGNPIIISGNHNHTTAEAVYPRSRIAAYVVPTN